MYKKNKIILLSILFQSLGIGEEDLLLAENINNLRHDKFHRTNIQSFDNEKYVDSLAKDSVETNFQIFIGSFPDKDIGPFNYYHLVFTTKLKIFNY